MTMPKWGIEMTEGTLSEWKVQAGERIKQGQIIAMIESDKIANEVEAEHDAVVARLIATEGDTFPVGDLLAVLAEGSASEPEIDAFIEGFRPAEGSAAAMERAESVASTNAAGDGAAFTVSTAGAGNRAGDAGDRFASTADTAHVLSATAPQAAAISISSDIAISPAARALAEQSGIDITSIKGSGRDGRITLQDVEQASNTAAMRAPQIVRMSAMRKAIARQLTLAKSTIPHFYLRNTVRIDALLAVRKRAKQASADVPSLNDYFIRATALALIEVPDVNVQVHDDAIHRFMQADISVAVATDKGLITPIVRAADTKSTLDIARETRELAERARAGRLRAEEFQGGSFTISNLGMFGIDEFDAIINPPQAAILAIGAARLQPIIENNANAIGTVVNLTLSCDHRAIDGAVGAMFMAALRKQIEMPENLAR
jgi:pyruvate dehydrogenase E2 component (dihydrolipoamide acetyltransferase)